MAPLEPQQNKPLPRVEYVYPDEIVITRRNVFVFFFLGVLLGGFGLKMLQILLSTTV